MELISPHAADELGWPRILEALAGRTRTPVGRELARALPFLPAREDIARHYDRVEEVRRLARQELEIPVSGVPDARAHLTRAEREGVLEPLAVLDCARLMRAAVRVRRFLVTRKETAPLLAEEAAGLSEFEPLAAEIERAIEPSGALSDLASPELASLRARVRVLHGQIKERIDDILHDLQYEEVLRDRYYSVRGDRYVLPVKASFRSALPGRVHNASQSGQTLFVEPDQLIDLGNQLTIAQSMIAEEERRILQDFTDAIGRRGEELARDQELLGEFDRVGACARLADDLDASEPELIGAEETFSLRRLRHPLLVLRGISVVANDVALSPGRRALVVSGPNAGGKTVTLTAVGLSVLMARAGLPVPADRGSRLPLHPVVLTAIGEEGDLSKDLSTFTAHLAALMEIDRQLVPGALVCIDEIAAGTDPREGAALAAAYLDHLVERGATVLVTTHLDEVKAKGLTDERFQAASVGFDAEKLAPTYRLKMNVAGSSSAIEVARRVGLPEAICEKARAVLGGSEGALGRAISALERERGELTRLEAALEEERNALARSREQWESLRAALEVKERQLVAGARRELLVEVEKAREEVRRTVARLQSTPSPRAATEARQALDREAERQRQAIARDEARAGAVAAKEALEPSDIRPGRRVRVAALGRDGEVMEVGAEEVLVAIGPMKIRVPTADLVPVAGKAPERRLRRDAAERAQVEEQLRRAPVTVVDRKIDLRGLRTEDALRTLRDALDRLLREAAPDALVLHGHGTGALKAAVREELESSPYAASFRPGNPEEGGDAVTIVQLRER